MACLVHRALRLFAPLLFSASVLLGATGAEAFCRSTTCSGDCPIDDDQGCKTTGKPLFWPGLCVGFSIQKDGTEHLAKNDVRAAIQAGFIAWSDVDCGGAPATIAFSELAEVACHRAEYNTSGQNANLVLFQDTKWSYQGEGNSVAKTTVTFDNDTGEILDADIELNHAYNEFSIGDDAVVYDLAAIVTHEVGHVIGLDHSPWFDATMNASYEPGQTSQRDLDVDDIDGVCAAYPPERSVTCDPTPHNGLGQACGSDGSASAASDAGGCAMSPSPRSSRFATLLTLSFLFLRAARLRRTKPSS